MINNIVLLSVEEYNELRDFKREVEESRNNQKFAVIDEIWESPYGRCGYKTRYYTESEAILDFEKSNDRLKSIIQKLESEIESNNKITIESLKKMSYFELLKLKIKGWAETLKNKLYIKRR